MSSISYKYADFGAMGSETSTGDAQNDALEDIKLQSFEEGYQAGWADAVKACETEEKSVSAELQQSLQDMSFTYVEALSKLTVALRPLLQALVESVLPKMIEATLAKHVAAQIETMLKDTLADEASIILGPKSKALLEQELTAVEHSLPLHLVVDPQISEGQMHFKVGSAEAKLDFDTLLKNISGAIDAHFSK